MTTAPQRNHQSARGCDVFCDAGAAGSAFVGGRFGKRRYLNEVEVVQESYPRDACEHVDPDDQAALVERNPAGYCGKNDREHDAGADRAVD